MMNFGTSQGENKNFITVKKFQDETKFLREKLLLENINCLKK